jgi:hypothetical protein
VRDYGELIAYGAGWTDPERQRPVGDTGRHEPRHADAIVDAELEDPDPLAEAVANARLPDAPEDFGVTPLRIGALPTSVRVFYERMHALLAVQAIARSTKPATFVLENPPSDAEKRFGSALGQAFHEGCSLADVALAAALPEDRIVAIGARTIRRRAWLDHLYRGAMLTRAVDRNAGRHDRTDFRR